MPLTNIVDLLIATRRELLIAIGGVENAGQGLAWDSTTPNSTTRAKLERLLQQELSSAERFGIYRVARHCQCDRPEHDGYIIERGTHGIQAYKDSAFNWNGCQLYQGHRVSPCPCVQGSAPTKHWVIEELVVRRESATPRHDRLIEALLDVQQAIDKAGDKRTRSAVREHLLRAVIHLNDGILPQSVDDYIASHKSKTV